MAVVLTGRDTLEITEHRKFGIYNYGTDNLYPNNTAIFAQNSPSLAAAISVVERFSFGRGMSTNQQFWKRVVNPYGLRVDQFLRRLVQSYSQHNGFAFKIVWNGLGEVEAVIPVKFENLRLKIADDNGIIKKVVYCSD